MCTNFNILALSLLKNNFFGQNTIFYEAHTLNLKQGWEWLKVTNTLAYNFAAYYHHKTLCNIDLGISYKFFYGRH